MILRDRLWFFNHIKPSASQTMEDVLLEQFVQMMALYDMTVDHPIQNIQILSDSNESVSVDITFTSKKSAGTFSSAIAADSNISLYNQQFSIMELDRRDKVVSVQLTEH